MKSKSSKKALPPPVAHRLPAYLSYLREKKEMQYIRSHEIAAALGYTPSTVRQDFTHLDVTGKTKRGYQTAGLTRIIEEALGVNVEKHAIVVGAGNMGKAIARHGALKEYGFVVSAIVDRDRKVIGQRVGNLRVQDLDKLPGIVESKNIEIGIIAVPSSAAQRVADRLILSGVRGLLNLAPTRVLTPRFVRVVNVRLVHDLMLLSHLGLPLD